MLHLAHQSTTQDRSQNYRSRTASIPFSFLKHQLLRSSVCTYIHARSRKHINRPLKQVHCVKPSCATYGLSVLTSFTLSVAVIDGKRAEFTRSGRLGSRFVSPISRCFRRDEARMSLFTNYLKLYSENSLMKTFP